MSIIQGGTAVVSGRAMPGPVGAFDIAFSHGALASVSAIKVNAFFAPGLTAGFEGVAVGVFREGSTSRAIAGVFHVYVDDLSGMTPPLPDQMIFTFKPKGGEMLVRHGRIIRGDILVIPE